MSVIEIFSALIVLAVGLDALLAGSTFADAMMSVLLFFVVVLLARILRAVKEAKTDA